MILVAWVPGRATARAYLPVSRRSAKADRAAAFRCIYRPATCAEGPIAGPPALP